MFVFSEVCVRHKCHRDSTEEILLAWSSLCCWRAGGARLRCPPSSGWEWSNTKHDHDVSLDVSTACHYIYIYIDCTLYIIIYIRVTSNTHDTGIYNSRV